MENIRVGIVSSVDPKKGTVRVTYPDKDDMVSAELQLMSNQQRTPKVGKSVTTLTLPNGQVKGFCLGEFFHDENIPPTMKEDEIVIDFEGAKIVGNRGSGELKITAEKLIIEVAEVLIKGKVNVEGTLSENNKRVQVM